MYEISSIRRFPRRQAAPQLSKLRSLAEQLVYNGELRARLKRALHLTSCSCGSLGELAIVDETPSWFWNAECIMRDCERELERKRECGGGRSLLLDSGHKRAGPGSDGVVFVMLAVGHKKKVDEKRTLQEPNKHLLAESNFGRQDHSPCSCCSNPCIKTEAAVAPIAAS